MNKIHVPYGRDSNSPGWWTKYNGIRVNCPQCGRFELCYWILLTEIKEDGTYIRPVKCGCGLEGTLVLDDYLGVIPGMRRDQGKFEEFLNSKGVK